MNKAEAQQAIQQAVQQTVAQELQSGPVPVPIPAQINVHQEQSVGPMPSPELLKRYNEAVPEGAERIMKMAENEQRHRHGMPFASMGLTAIGEIFSWRLVALAMGGAYWLV